MAKHATVTEGLQEDRTRVTLFLPNHTTGDTRAVRVVTKYLHSQRKCKTCRVTGYTTSVFPDSPFWGVWWSPRRKKWVPEKVTIVVIDYDKRMEEPALDSALHRLKNVIQVNYKRFSREQEVVWMTASKVIRFA